MLLFCPTRLRSLPLLLSAHQGCTYIDGSRGLLNTNPMKLRVHLCLALLALSVSLPSHAASPTVPSGQSALFQVRTTRVETDDAQKQIRFIIDHKVVAVLVSTGLIVEGDVRFTGSMVDQDTSR